ESVRRDRAVGARSERALPEQRREGREQLPLSRAPLRRTSHRDVQRLRERLAEELRPVEQRLDDAKWLGSRALSERLEHCGLRRRMTVVDDREPHPITSSATSSLRSPSAIATTTVCSKISSSEKPASLRASMSRSETAYARSRTFSR